MASCFDITTLNDLCDSLKAFCASPACIPCVYQASCSYIGSGACLDLVLTTFDGWVTELIKVETDPFVTSTHPNKGNPISHVGCFKSDPFDEFAARVAAMTCSCAPIACSAHCAVDCDGAASITIIASGFVNSISSSSSSENEDCALLNGIYTISRYGPCNWSWYNGSSGPGGAIAQVVCYGVHWIVAVTLLRVVDAVAYPAALACSGDHPTGSGAFTYCTATGQYEGGPNGRFNIP